MRTALIAIGAAALLVLAGVRYIGVRHRLLERRDAISAEWAQVDRAMQRRADVVFGLAASLRNPSQDSRAVAGEISEARAMLAESRTPREKMGAYERLNQAISRLVVVVGNERRLKLGTKLSHLPDDVSNTENEVNLARQRYNEALENYNTALQLFPNNIVAAVSGFTRDDAYFQTGAGAGQAKM